MQATEERTQERPVAEYNFSNSWFQSSARVAWDALLPEVMPKRILEIGSYEGASTCYLIQNCGKQSAIEVHCVDSWEGGEEHKASGTDMQSVEARFKHNTQLAIQSVAGKVELVAHKGLSSIRLADILSQKKANYFDFIYVDGSHQAPDVLLDAVLSFQLLKVGGTMIFDDYLWGAGSDPLHCPKPAIDAFMNIYYQKMKVLSVGIDGGVARYLPLYQLYTRKLAN
jgi:predicted O-methyltransferase YrrM